MVPRAAKWSKQTPRYIQAALRSIDRKYAEACLEGFVRKYGCPHWALPVQESAEDDSVGASSLELPALLDRLLQWLVQLMQLVENLAQWPV